MNTPIHKISLLWGALCILLFQQCKDPYNPPAVASPNQYLVVDGFINSSDSTQFVLSKTVNLSQTSTSNPVGNAQFLVEGDNNFSITLNEIHPGIYKAYHASLDTSHRYRIRITLKEGNEYISDYVPLKNSPPIDTVEWQALSTGLQILVSTHDPAALTKYYRWDFEETWAYHAPYDSYLIYTNFDFAQRPAKDDIYTCWNADTSRNLNVATTLQLSEDKVSRYSLTQIPPDNQKLSYQYSILVKQYALSQEGFQYWQNLRRLSETMGSIFDPQPAQINGNIKSTSNKDELVLGFVSAGSLSQKRIFINHTNLPYYIPEDQSCASMLNKDSLGALPWYYFVHNIYVPLQYIRDSSQKMFLQYAPSECADCRTKGGTTTKPGFWQF